MLAVNGYSAGVTVNVVDANSKLPLAGVRVEREQPVSFVSKIFNPVGAFYHPTRTAESGVTNPQGDFTFAKFSKRDLYLFFPGRLRSLLITVSGKQILVSPSPASQGGSNFGYSVYFEGGTLKESQ